MKLTEKNIREQEYEKYNRPVCIKKCECAICEERIVHMLKHNKIMGLQEVNLSLDREKEKDILQLLNEFGLAYGSLGLSESDYTNSQEWLEHFGNALKDTLSHIEF